MIKKMEILSKQLIKDAIVGALEGGSNEWYNLDNKAIAEIRKVVTHEQCPFLAEALGEAVFKGANIEITDVEDVEEVHGTLSMDSINKGLYKMVSEGRTELNEMRLGEDDALTHDVIFQYFVLGEIVFG